MPQDGQAIREGNLVKKSGKWRQVWIVEDLAVAEPTVPKAVTMRQARSALRRPGLIAQVQALMNALPGEAGD